DTFLKDSLHSTMMTDLMIGNSSFSESLYRRAFRYDGEILVAGTPRLDQLFKDNNDLNIEKEVSYILYAPTFRMSSDSSIYRLPFNKIIQTMNSRYNKTFKILLRLHPNVSYLSSEIIDENIIDVSHYADIYSLFKVSDLLITDYSSLMFEFGFTYKPVILYTPDLNDYDRDFYFNFSTIPYFICYNKEQLISTLGNYNHNEYIDKLLQFHDELGVKETGEASKIVGDFLIENNII
ncbi:CDP-glycerol glycerophosphotransferase family protein, partial [Aerococcaceae bacterium zg-1292]|nr:CDP-glycerol glycerophosphotransferase family protein [Aerococcaceae bacterium zg-1292]